MGHVHLHLSLLLTAVTTLMTAVHAYLPTYYMDEWCTTTLDLNVQNIHAGRLLLRPPSRGMRFLDCFVFLKAPPGRRLSFTFKGFDVESPYGCQEDHLQLFDDWAKRRELTGRMCNSAEHPEGMYTTTTQEAMVQLMKKRYLDDQAEIIFTAFHLAPCASGEFQCANSHCIAESLYCNDYNNCGDRSDVCLLNTPAIIAVAFCAVIVVVLIAVIVAVIIYRRKQHHHMEKLRTRHYVVVHDGNGRPVVMQEDLVHYVEAWDKKSTLSDSPPTSSSRLSTKDYGVKSDAIFSTSMGEDTLTKKPIGDSFSSKKRSSEKSLLHASSLKSSKNSRSQNGVQDIYAVPRKKSSKKSFLSWGRKSPSPKYANASIPHYQLPQQQPAFATFIDPLVITPSPLMTGEMKAADDRERMRGDDADGNGGGTPRPTGLLSTRVQATEGMWEQAERDMPLNTLDPSALPGAQHLLRPGSAGGADVYDHVMSFRSYASPEQSRKERVVYLYPGGHPGYHRLHRHGHQEALVADRQSLHSSHSSLVKL